MENLMDLEIREYEEMENKERFKIDNLGSANWAFRKLKAIKDKEKEVQDLYQAEIDRIKSWKDKELKQFENGKEFFESLLTEYFIEQKKIDPNFKVSTPYGKVSSRKQQPKFKRDEDILLQWTKQNKPEYVKVKESPDWAGLKKEIEVKNNVAVTKDGEIIEGVIVEERPDSINVKVAD